MEIFDEAFSKADFILTYEGPVDIYGYGETIPTMFGPAGKYISSNHGKFLVRSANIKKTTAITIPTRDLASGLVLCTKAGVNYGKKALYLAIELQSKIKLPEVWRRYFIN